MKHLIHIFVIVIAASFAFMAFLILKNEITEQDGDFSVRNINSGFLSSFIRTHPGYYAVNDL